MISIRYLNTCAKSVIARSVSLPPISPQQPQPDNVVIPKQHKGFKRFLKKRSLDDINNDRILLDELKTISTKSGYRLIANSSARITTFWNQRTAPVEEVDIEISHLSKITGHGIGYHTGLQNFIVIPSTIPGDIVKCQLKRHYDYHIEAKFIQYIRQEERSQLPRCKYFNVCSGCQLQMLSYNQQLSYKRNIISYAFEKNGFTGLKDVIQDTVASPLQYNYRSKLTPHTDGRNGSSCIGLNDITGNQIVDIDRCEISTDAVNEGLVSERHRLSTVPSNDVSLVIREDQEKGFLTDPKSLITEKIGDKTFQFPIYTFFQNNRSILPSLLEFIESKIRQNAPPSGIKRFTNLVDTYCGSGFFGISLSHLFDHTYGIEISSKSVEFAKHNAMLNSITNINFIEGSAQAIFNDISHLNPLESVVIIDPSRKGSNMDFLKQLAVFKPALIVYVSCNVFSQARDLNDFMVGLNMADSYKIESVTGFDFFPQTKHVESVAILKRSDL